MYYNYIPEFIPQWTWHPALTLKPIFPVFIDSHQYSIISRELQQMVFVLLLKN